MVLSPCNRPKDAPYRVLAQRRTIFDDCALADFEQCPNARLLVRGGRARWKNENETFNTLKNQGYHYVLILHDLAKELPSPIFNTS
jgi:hypothetical protein